LQRIEVRAALLVEHHGLPVEDHGRRTKGKGGLCNRRKAPRPIESAASDDTGLASLDMNSDAVSVPFDFESPLRPDGRL
jgi:hypothetical protein